MRPRWIQQATRGVANLAAAADQQYEALTQARETIIDNCYEIADLVCATERGGHERCKLCPLAAIEVAMQAYEAGELSA